MQQVQVQVQVKARKRTRDDDLRQAHGRAFQKIKDSAMDRDRRRRITQAIEELIDACEVYVAS